MRKRSAKRRRAAVPTVPTGEPALTSERLQHDRFGKLKVSQSAYDSAIVDFCETSTCLGRYFYGDGRSAPKISQRQFEAGSMLYRDFYLSRIETRQTSSYEPRISSSGGGASDITDMAMEARTRYTAACAAIPGALRNVVINVVCFDESALLAAEMAHAPSLAGTEGKNRMSRAIGTLVTGLDLLADYYGM